MEHESDQTCRVWLSNYETVNWRTNNNKQTKKHRKSQDENDLNQIHVSWFWSAANSALPILKHHTNCARIPPTPLFDIVGVWLQTQDLDNSNSYRPRHFETDSIRLWASDGWRIGAAVAEMWINNIQSLGALGDEWTLWKQAISFLPSILKKMERSSEKKKGKGDGQA